MQVSRAQYRIKVEKDVPATMRDGTRLTLSRTFREQFSEGQ